MPEPTPPHKLAPCPASPNCVSSLAEDDKHRIEPFILSQTLAASWPALVDIVSKQPRTRIVDSQPGYLHAEVRSLIFRFLDHLELSGDANGYRLDVRSASVTGYSDLGVNRKRVETLRRAFEAQGLLKLTTD